MRTQFVIPVIASILILGAIAIPNAGLAYGQLCPVTGCLTGNLYVSDNEDNKILQYNSDGTLINDEFITDLDSPRGIAFDSEGNLYVANLGTGTIRQYNSDGTGGTDFITGLKNPNHIAFDSEGNLFVANLGFSPSATEGTVDKYRSDGELITADFATGVLFPQFIAFDSEGNLYVVDSTRSTVRQYNSDGGLKNADFTSPFRTDYRGIAFDSTGKLYVAVNNGQVRQFESDGTLKNLFFATGLIGPSGIAFDSTGKFYVTDVRADTIRQYNSDGTGGTDFITGLSLALFIAFDTPPSLAASFTELPILPGGDFSFGIDISDDGSVVVVNSNNAMGEFLGAKWTATGGLVPIDDLPGGPNESFPTAVSADGSVIVGGGTTEEGQEAFMWTETGETVGLGPGFGSGALGVSADGSVIVGAKQVGFEAFMWTAAGGIVGLGGGLEGADEFTAAYDVTDDGLLIVGGGNTAYTWTETTDAVPIDDPLFNGAFAVSSDGTVIVGQANVEATPTSGPTIGAAKWTEAEGGVLLGSLPGNAFSLANAVSPDGSIIVGSSSCTSDCTIFNSVAFIWDKTNGMRNLQQVLEDDFGLDLNDLDLTVAWGVTSNGFITVTGEAINPSGDIRGWVAVMELESSDTTPPVLTVPADVTLEAPADTTPSNTGTATATDTVDPTPTVTSSDVSTPGTGQTIETITRTWTATDDSGNSVSADQIITVQDTTPPVLTVPADFTIQTTNLYSVSVNYVVTVPDTFDPNPVFVCVPASGDLFAVDTTTLVTCDATDASGNTSNASFNVTVEKIAGAPSDPGPPPDAGPPDNSNAPPDAGPPENPGPPGCPSPCQGGD